MVGVRIVERPAFPVIGRKVWIEGTDCGQFGLFWQKCSEDGTLDLLYRIGLQPGPNTGGLYIGVSMVEKDPADRNFFFLVAVEYDGGEDDSGLEEYTVPASRWAVFRNSGSMPGALIEAEMHAFTQWLPSSGFIHAAAPELEVYLPCGKYEDTLVEFWLPILTKQ